MRRTNLSTVRLWCINFIECQCGIVISL